MKETDSHSDSSRAFCLFTRANLDSMYYYILKCYWPKKSLWISYLELFIGNCVNAVLKLLHISVVLGNVV